MEAFVKKLVSSVRDKAFKTLCRWLEARCTELEPKECLRLWKALFYCMWMADRPAYQQKLARRLGDIWLDLHKISPEAGLLYATTFWETMCREWGGIDRLRLDKYYFLVKRFYLAGFEVMQLDGTDAMVYNVGRMLAEWPLSGKPSVPDALRLHLLENFAAVLGGVELGRELTEALMRPYVELVAQTDRKPVQAMGETFFQSLVPLKQKLDLRAVSQQTLAAGEAKDIKTRNREILYAATRLLKTTKD